MSSKQSLCSPRRCRDVDVIRKVPSRQCCASFMHIPRGRCYLSALTNSAGYPQKVQLTSTKLELQRQSDSAYGNIYIKHQQPMTQINELTCVKEDWRVSLYIRSPDCQTCHRKVGTPS